MLDKFHRDLLYELKCGFSVFTNSATRLITGTLSSLPSLCLLQTLEIVLFLQLCNEGIIGSKLSFGGEVLGYWRSDTILFGLICRHGRSVGNGEEPYGFWMRGTAELGALRKLVQLYALCLRTIAIEEEMNMYLDDRLAFPACQAGKVRL